MGGVETDRGQHRQHLPIEEIPDPRALGVGPFGAPHEADAFGIERRQDLLVEQLVLLGDDLVHLAADPLVEFGRLEAVAIGAAGQQAQLFLDAGHPHLEEFVEVAGDDADEAQPLEQRHRRIGRLREHPALELQQRQLAVDEVALFGFDPLRRVVHGVGRALA